jgi:hypothetical protein
MADFLNQASDGDLVSIETVSDRASGEQNYRPPVARIDRAAMVKLALALARVGGTRNGFNTEALKAGPASGAPVYTLLGWAGAGEGNGQEAALGVDGVGNAPDLSGTPRRNLHTSSDRSRPAPPARHPARSRILFSSRPVQSPRRWITT